MSYDHSLSAEAILKPGTTQEQVENALGQFLEYFDYKTLNDDLYADHQIEFDPDAGSLYIYTNGDVGDSFGPLIWETAKDMGPLTKEPGYFVLSNHDTPNLDEAQDKIYFGSSKEAIEAFMARESANHAVSLLEVYVDHDLAAKIRDMVDQSLNGKKDHPVNQPEKILSVMMQDIVGGYDTPDMVPEWGWVERVANYAHTQNGEYGIWEFVLNLSLEWDDVPDRLRPVISNAKANNIAYLLIHQGT